VRVSLDKPDTACRVRAQRGNAADAKNRALACRRLLPADARGRRWIVRFHKQIVVDSRVRFQTDVLEELAGNVGSAAGVLRAVPADFVPMPRDVPELPDDERISDWAPAKLNDRSVFGAFVDFDRHTMCLKVVNKGVASGGQLAFALNKNPIGLAVLQPQFPQVLADPAVRTCRRRSCRSL
jgi:hypothetical protein